MSVVLALLLASAPVGDDDRMPRSQAYSDVARQSLAGGSDQTPRRGGTYTLNIGFEPTTLNNLIRVGHTPGVICREYLFPPLLDLDGDSMQMVPELAAEMPEVLDDGRRLRFTLREGVRWHRGLPSGEPVEVTTRDVLYSWKMLQSPEVRADTVRSSLSRFQDLTVLDERSFEVHVDPPYFKAVTDFGWDFRLMPAHLGPDDPEEFQQDPRAKDPVGYGPYRLERWKDGQHITLVRNDEYPVDQRRPFHLERLRFVFVRDTERVMEMFRRGELSTCTVDNVDRFEEAKEDEELQRAASFHEYYISRWDFLVWNTRHWAFSDPRVRRAMTHLFPREQACEQYYRGHARVVSGPFAFIGPEYDSSIEPLAHDVGRALELLKDAGFEDHDGDGVLDRDGRALEFTLLRSTNRIPAMDRAIQLFQFTLKRAGVILNEQPIEFPTMLRRLREHDFDCGRLAWVPDPKDPDLYPIFHSSAADGGYNYADYRDEEMDALLQAYRDELDHAARMDIAHAIHRKFHEDQPFTMLPTPQTLLMVSSKFRDVAISRRGALIARWWMPED